MLILGIETSCDETAAAVIEICKTSPSSPPSQGGERGEVIKIKSNIIASQHEIHNKYGGVVPELACRRHIENISPVIKEALNKAGININDIDLFAVTRGPGLIVALLVGLSTAKAIAYVLKKPLIGINHLEGHILSIFLEKPDISFPFISLLVSGGHTELYLVEGFGKYKALGRSRDDAAGEAFDKASKMLKLGYPGGPAIEKAAIGGNPLSINFPRAYMDKDSLDFSFSGVKTALKNYIDGFIPPYSTSVMSLPDISASFQQAVVDVLINKAFLAAKMYNVKTIVIAGGVASNKLLRDSMQKRGIEEGITVYYPSPVLCTDNAAMIACAGHHRFIKDKNGDVFYNMDAEAQMKL
ncbi:MAG TPA: tRNA (adenosine(37)-N6)-threonylcarbamoyltransferase complex transferase subunit TsaD [Nitrospinota bacterium]|nr:tRNA (adenosine(37)-N6)-threonylcarbamoyltransferase complex transferase subunit TsaD [Nitrospinota bacterium]